jgi:hypothetical protein
MFARPALLPLALLAIQERIPKEPNTESLAAFRFDAAKLEVGRVFQYEHSNIDGTHATRVSLYWAAENRLESLKWSVDWNEATLVVAEMDWKTFSVKSFETYRITEDGARKPLARLDTIDNEIVAGLGGSELRCAVERLPWHSYDFDLSSLNVSLRFLADPEEPLVLGIADAGQGPAGSAFLFKGDVELLYLEDEEREGRVCRKYSVDGPGLADRGGFLWAAKTERPYFVDFELDLPDEPGLTSGKLRFLSSEELGLDEWKSFVVEREG